MAPVGVAVSGTVAVSHFVCGIRLETLKGNPQKLIRCLTPGQPAVEESKTSWFKSIFLVGTTDYAMGTCRSPPPWSRLPEWGVHSFPKNLRIKRQDPAYMAGDLCKQRANSAFRSYTVLPAVPDALCMQCS